MLIMSSENHGPEHGEVAIAALQLLASFARLQDAIGWLARAWIDRHQPPAREPQLSRTNLRSMRDDDLISLFLEIAGAAQTDVDLSQVKPVFNRVKDTRDLLAHSLMLFFGEDQHGSPTIGFPFYHGEKRVKSQDGGNTKFTVVKLNKRIASAEWLLDIVEYVRQQAGYPRGPIWKKETQNRPERLPSS